MLMQPYCDPSTDTPAWTTLTRVWCIFELYACESSKCRFEATMTDSMYLRFRNDLLRETSIFCKTLDELDCEKCEGVDEDRNCIFGVIERTIGFAPLNSMVLQVLERWIYSELSNQIKRSNSIEDQKCFLRSMECICSTLLERRRKTLGYHHRDTILSRCIVNYIQKTLLESQTDPVAFVQSTNAIMRQAEIEFVEALSWFSREYFEQDSGTDTLPEDLQDDLKRKEEQSIRVGREIMKKELRKEEKMQMKRRMQVNRISKRHQTTQMHYLIRHRPDSRVRIN